MLKAVPLRSSVAPPAWASIARLLAYLLGEPEPSANPRAAPEHARQPHSPPPAAGWWTWRRSQRPACQPVAPRPANLVLRSGGAGLTVLLPDLVDSIRLGWSACRSKPGAAAGLPAHAPRVWRRATGQWCPPPAPSSPAACTPPSRARRSTTTPPPRLLGPGSPQISATSIKFPSKKSCLELWATWKPSRRHRRPARTRLPYPPPR